MGSKERIMRIKDENRKNILAAALNIAENEGWEALTMRKIADEIEYTAPVIYEYFSNKQDILDELSRKGFMMLYTKVHDAGKTKRSSSEILENMWMAYWDFAMNNKDLYKLMWGVNMTCCRISNISSSEGLHSLFRKAISSIYRRKSPSEDDINIKYVRYWTSIHGLITMNLLEPHSKSIELNEAILCDTLNGITASILYGS